MQHMRVLDSQELCIVASHFPHKPPIPSPSSLSYLHFSSGTYTIVMFVSKDYFSGVCRFFVRMRCVASTTQRTEQDSNSEGDDNRFTLYTSSEFTDMDCCGQSSQMEGCKMKIDVKCAKTIRHSSHSHPHNHKPLVLNRIPSGGKTKMCHGCRDYLKECTSVYCCSSDDHDFAFHLRCAMQPKSIRKHEWDTNRI